MATKIIWDNLYNDLPTHIAVALRTARLKPEHFITHLWNRQTESDFAKLFDDTLRDIAIRNNDIRLRRTSLRERLQKP